MTALDLVIRAEHVVSAAGEVGRVIGVKGGTIVAIEPLDSDLTGAVVVELAADEVLMPGLVDAHVHVNEPGRTEWEGFATATRAAAAGGVTTIVDMPLNSIPPTKTVAALEAKRAVAADQAWVGAARTSARCGGCSAGKGGEMPRVKRSVHARKKRRKLLAEAKGFSGQPRVSRTPSWRSSPNAASAPGSAAISPSSTRRENAASNARLAACASASTPSRSRNTTIFDIPIVSRT